MLYLLVVLGFLFFAGIAMTVNEGLWSNTILLFCILISGCMAAVCGAPLGVFILEKADLGSDNAWYCVFAGLWGTFAITLLIMRILVDKASTVRVRFLPLVDKIGGIVMGLVAAMMLTSFAANTLLSAPIAAKAWKDDGGYKARLRQVGGPFSAVESSFIRSDDVDSSFLTKKN